MGKHDTKLYSMKLTGLCTKCIWENFNTLYTLNTLYFLDFLWWISRNVGNVKMKNVRKKWYSGTPKSKGSAWVVGHEVGGMALGFDRREEVLYSWESETRPSSKRHNVSRSTESNRIWVPETPSSYKDYVRPREGKWLAMARRQKLTAQGWSCLQNHGPGQ